MIKFLNKYFDPRHDYIMLGFAIMFSSTTFGLAANSGLIRFAALVGGFLICAYSLYKNLLKNPHKYLKFVIIISFIWVILLGLSFVLNHMIFYPYLNRQFLIFWGINYIMLIAGYFIGINALKNVHGMTFNMRYVIPTLACLTALLYFLFFRDQIAYLGLRRSADDLGNPVGMAYIFGTLSIFSFCAFLYAKNLIQLAISAFAIMISVGCIILVQTRGALIYLSISLILMLLLAFAKGGRDEINKLKIIRNLSLGVIGLIPGILFIRGGAFIERFISYIERMLAIFQSTATQGTVDVTTNNRLETWNLALESILNHWLIGSPFYNYYPHNNFLELCLRFGLVGFILFLAIIYFMGRFYFILLKLRTVNYYMLIFFGLLTFSFMQHLTSLSFDINRTFYFALGFSIGFAKISRYY